MIRLENLVAGYGKRRVIKSIDATFRDREIVGIIGPNGSGKSTLAKCVCGLIDVWSGSLYYDDTDISDSSMEERSEMGILYSPQENFIFDNLTVKENILVGNDGAKWSNIIDVYTHKMSNADFLENRKNDLATSLSGGQQQVVALLRVLAREPNILVLDEPMNGLSDDLCSEVVETIKWFNRKKNATLFVIEHKLDVVINMSSKVIGLKEGKKVYDGKINKKEKKDAMEAVFA